MADNETGVSPNTPMQDLIGQMNYQAATSAAGLNLSKQMNNMLTAVNMNVGKVNASVTKVDGTLNKMYDMSKSINMNIGKVNANITALGKRHDDTNKILSDILKGIGGKPGGVNVYENVENKMEQKDVSSNIQIMTDTLKSIDETLKKFNTNSAASPSLPSSLNVPAIGAGAGIGAAAVSVLRFLAGSVALPAAAAYTINMNQDMFGPNSEKGKLLHEYMEKKKRENSEAAYRANREQFLKNSSAADGPVWQRYGRVGPNTTMMDMAVAGDIMNRHANDGPLQAYNGYGSKIAAFPQVPLGTNTNRLSYNAKGYGDDILPYAPTPNDGLILGSMETKAGLDQQQASIEKQSKDMTKSELLYEATDVIYKATNIRFEASSIQFMGATGSAGVSSGGAKRISSGPNSGSNGPYDNGGGLGSNFGDKQYSETPTTLTGDAKTSFNNIQSGMNDVYSGSSVSSWAGLSNEELAKGGIIRSEQRGAGGGTVYSKKEASADEIEAAKKAVATGTAGLKGKQKTIKQVYDAFIKAGFSPNQAKALTAEVGRENDFNLKNLFGRHVDAANGKINEGFFSWQGSRGKELDAFMRSKGLVDKNGNIIQGQEALDAMAEFARNEMMNNPAYAKTKKGFLENKEIGQAEAANILGNDYIRWDMAGNHINPIPHMDKRDNYYNQIGKISDSVKPDGNISQSQIDAQIKSNRESALAGKVDGKQSSVTGQTPPVSSTDKPKTATQSSAETVKPTQPALPFKNADLANGVSTDLTKIAEKAAKDNPELFGVPSPEDAKKAGVEGIAPGTRTAKQQKEFMKKGWSKTMNSKHIENQALDLWPINPATGKLDPNYTEGYSKIAEAMKKASEELGIPIEWGGDWKKWQDRPHWQIPKGKKPTTDEVYTAPKKNIIPSLGYGNPNGDSVPSINYVDPHEFDNAYMSMRNPTQRAYDSNDPSYSGSGLKANDVAYQENIRNQQAIKRTESLRREEARRNNREAEESKRSRDKGKAAETKKESHEPRNPHSSSRKQMDSVLVRHNDWWKNWSATA